MGIVPVYEASPVKRPRSTKAEKSERDYLLAWAGDFR